MPIFDLKRVMVRFQDGTLAIGAVNNVSGYTTGSTTMLVDGFTGILPVGSMFTLTGDVTEYVITATSQTSGNTTSITFTPGLVIAATDDEVITVGPNFLDIKIGEGTFSFTQKNPIEYKKNRGLLYQVRKGDQEPMDIKMSFWWEFLTSLSGGIVPTPYEVLNQIGPASSWLTTNPDPCAPYCIDIVLLFAPPCPGVFGEIYHFGQFYPDEFQGDAKTGEINCPGKCNTLAPIISRASLNYASL